MTDFDQRMALLKARFAERLADEHCRMAELAERSGDAEAQAELQVRAHKLAGLAGSMGYAELSRRARAVDDCFAQEGGPGADLPELAASLLGELSTIVNG